MTNDQIISLAREAGGADITCNGWTSWVGTQTTEFLERFTALVAAHEREKQAEQEPVAWALSHSMGLEFGSKYPIQETKEAAEQMARQHMGAVVVTPLYAAPVRTKDLTDDEIWEAYSTVTIPVSTPKIARAVIAADRRKNK